MSYDPPKLTAIPVAPTGHRNVPNLCRGGAPTPVLTYPEQPDPGLRELRVAVDLTLRDVAEAFGLRLVEMSGIERGTGYRLSPEDLAAARQWLLGHSGRGR